MHYLTIKGAPRGFRALFTGREFYCPERIPTLEDEVLIEKSSTRRLQAFLAPYFDGDLRLHQCLPTVSPNIGTFKSVNDKCAVFIPTTHILEQPFRLIASLLDTFASDLLQTPLHYFANSTQEAAAFCAAFPVEQKFIYFPQDTSVPKKVDNATFNTVLVESQKEYMLVKDKFMGRLELRLDGVNLFRVLGLAAFLLNVIFLAGEEKRWFYGDDFCLALPADNLEYILAAYYLAQSGLPIRKIFAISSQDRLAYGFLKSGGLSPSLVPMDLAFQSSLIRILYEISKGSMPKVQAWMDNLKQKGTFMADSGSQNILQKKIEAHFSGRNMQENMSPIELSKSAQAAYHLSQEQQITTIVIEEMGQVETNGMSESVSSDDVLTRIHR